MQRKRSSLQLRTATAAPGGADLGPALMKNSPPGGSEWIACHCCGRLFPAENVVRFRDHPDDALCVSCVEWLYVRSRPIVRRLYPIWQLRTRAAPGRVCDQGCHADVS